MSKQVFGAIVLALLFCGLLCSQALRAEVVIIGDTFANTSPDREVNDPLNDVETEVGDVTWTATEGAEFGSGIITNSNTDSRQLGGVPFNPEDYPDFDTCAVEAVVDPGQSNWIGAGFSSSPTGILTTYGLVWMLLRSGGQVEVYAYGITQPLYSGNPNLAQSGNNTMRLEYNKVEHSVRAWLNGYEITLTISDLDALPPDPPVITHAAFQGTYAGGYPATGRMVVDSFKVTGHITPRQNLIADSFGNESPDREPGDPLHEVFTEIGPQRWEADPTVVLQSGSATVTAGSSAMASLAIAPEDYPEYLTTSMAGTVTMVDMADTDWVTFLFKAAVWDPGWTNRQITMSLKGNGRIILKAGSTNHLLYDSVSGHPSFIAGGANHMRLDFSRHNHRTRAWLNGHELDLDASYDLGIISDINYAGIHVSKGTGFSSGDLEIQDFSVSLTGKVYVADQFTNNDSDRSVGASLDDVEPEDAPDLLVWDAEVNAGFGNGIVTNLVTPGNVAGGVPFVPDDHVHHPISRVEAMVDPSQLSYTCLGFKAAATDPCWTNRQLIMTLKSDGRVIIRGNGNGLLYSDAAANSNYLSGQANHLLLEHNRLDLSARAWLNGVELDLDLAPLDGWVPSITAAGFHAYKDTPFAAPGEASVDDFYLSFGDETPPLGIGEMASPRYPELGSTLEINCPISGGVEPYSPIWQYRPPGGTYSTLADGGRISNSATVNLRISSIESGDAGHYLCIANDTDPQQVPVISSPVEVIVAQPQPTSGCDPLVPAPGDFTTLSRFAEWTPWTAYASKWSFNEAAPAADFHTNTNAIRYQQDEYVYGEITRSGVAIPTSYDKLQIELPYLVQGQGVRLRLCWQEHCSAAATASTLDGLPEVVTWELGNDPDWHDGSDVDGYYTRDLTLQFLSADRIGQLERIDLFPGPKLTLPQKPVLRLADDPDNPEAITYGYGARMNVEQRIWNIGCNLLLIPAHARHRSLRFTLCKSDGSWCWNEGFSCRPSDPNDPDNLATVYGDIYTDGRPNTVPDPVQSLCELILPHPDLVPPEHANDTDLLGFWTLQSHFENNPDEISPALTFTLAKTGTPNLKVADSTVTLHHEVPGGLEEGNWIERDSPVTLSFSLRSHQYPTSTPTSVQILARAAEPGTDPPTNWALLTEYPLPSVGYSVPLSLSGITFGTNLLPSGEDYALLDLKIVVDPDNTVPELSNSDNSLIIEEWLLLTAAPLDDTSGEQVPGLVESFDGQGPLGLPFSPDWMSAGISNSQLTLYYLNCTAPDETPYVSWSLSQDDRISGVLLVTKQMVSSGTSRLRAGAGPGVHDPTVEDISLIGSENELAVDNQWHTQLWRDGSYPPFTDYQDLPELAFVQRDGQGIWSLYLGIKDNEIYSTGDSQQCVPKNIGFLRVWMSPETPTGGLEATGFRYRIGSDPWYDLDPDSPPELFIGDELSLQAVVTNAGDAIPGEITLTAAGSMRYLDNTIETLSSDDVTYPSLSSQEVVTLELGTFTIQDIPGSAELSFQFSATQGTIIIPSAVAWITLVPAPPGCTTSLALPVNVKDAR